MYINILFRCIRCNSLLLIMDLLICRQTSSLHRLTTYFVCYQLQNHLNVSNLLPSIYFYIFEFTYFLYIMSSYDLLKFILESLV